MIILAQAKHFTSRVFNSTWDVLREFGLEGLRTRTRVDSDSNSARVDLTTALKIMNVIQPIRGQESLYKLYKMI